MPNEPALSNKGRGLIVGSFGNLNDLGALSGSELTTACNAVEMRLDLLFGPANPPNPAVWAALEDLPLLFTARRGDEGGQGNLPPDQRMAMLRSVIEHAAWVDVEVASMGEMAPLLSELKERRIPWIASFHNFEELPATGVLEDAAQRAREAGAAVFKAAARLHSPADLSRLAEFQLSDQGIPLATMGMGPLAPVSRLLCLQCGSVLNYGFLGETATAPGQWDAGFLQLAADRLVPLPRH